jgi:hypothetical protein
LIFPYGRRLYILAAFPLVAILRFCAHLAPQGFPGRIYTYILIMASTYISLAVSAWVARTIA